MKKRKGRTLSITIDELLESKRLEYAIKLFSKGKKMALKAILVELGLECLDVARVNTTRRAVSYKSLVTDDLLLVLRAMTPDDFNTFNIHWNLSKPEQDLYLAEISGDNVKIEGLLERVERHFTVKQKEEGGN